MYLNLAHRPDTVGVFTDVVGSSNINPLITGSSLPVGLHQFRAYFSNCGISANVGMILLI